ncbi:MAG TPA: Dabb family protein [Syntrophales bacterium]|nr:Dabb family protein [Syntrophales bacterium]
MKKFLVAIMLVTTILFGASAFAAGPTVHHVVLVKLKNGVTPQQVEEMITVGKALLSKIPGVLEVSFGKKAREDRPVHIKDYDLAIYVRWENNETGNTYAPHILHQTFIKLYSPLWSLRIIDFYGN